MDDRAVQARKQFVILVVDDDENDRRLVKQAFSEEGDRHDFEVDLRQLRDGVELLEYLDHCTSKESPKGPMPNFILLDLNMPAMGGRETLQKVKTHPACRRLPIIVFATSAEQGDVIECFHCGGSAFSMKPDNHETLRRAVSTIVDYWLCSARSPASPPFSCMGYG
jgi:CheY-like chemotaxis protein